MDGQMDGQMSRWRDGWMSSCVDDGCVDTSVRLLKAYYIHQPHISGEEMKSTVTNHYSVLDTIPDELYTLFNSYNESHF